MKNGILFRRFYFLTLGVILIVGASPLWAKSDKTIKMITPEELEWKANPEKPDEVSAAVVWGDMKKGPHAAFHKFKAGLIMENHTHSANLRGVVVSGSLEAGSEDAPKKLGPGSYFNIPGNAPHVTKCVSTTDCILYIESSGKFDMKLVKKSKK
jgi:Domain of unknown function (DUF4437)